MQSAMNPRRFLIFALIGGGVMATGLGVMVLLVEGMGVGKHWAYLLQTVVTVELNFFLNARFTWPQETWRRMWGSWTRFHGMKAATMAGSQVLFAALLTLTQSDMARSFSLINAHDYVIAYLGCVALVTLVNFLGNDRWVFRSAGR